MSIASRLCLRARGHVSRQDLHRLGQLVGWAELDDLVALVHHRRVPRRHVVRIARLVRLRADRDRKSSDEARASSTRFGGIILQGGVTSGLLNSVVAEDLPEPGSVLRGRRGDEREGDASAPRGPFLGPDRAALGVDQSFCNGESEAASARRT